MTCRKLTSLVKPAMLIFCAVALSLSASRAANANSITRAPGKAASIERNTRESKRALLRIINRAAKTNPKFAKSLAAACSCAVAPNASMGFTTCMKQCLENAGVNAMSAAACAASCAANPIGCAICAGVAEWIVMYCGQYCVWRQVFNYTEASMRPSRTRSVYQAKLSSQPAPAG
jgi:hypothetical protein